MITVLGALVFAPSYAWAAGAAKAIAVHVEGYEVESMRGAALAVVPPSLRVIETSTFTNALAKEGQRGSIGPTLQQAKTRDKALVKLRKAAAATSADAVIVVRTRKSGGGFVATVLLVDQSPGDLTVDEEITLPSGDDARKAALHKVLDAHLEQLAGAKPEASAAAPTTAPTTTETPAAPPPADTTGEREKNKVSTALLVASVAFEIGGRRFAYSDPITANTRDYDVFGAPMPALGLEVYPAAGTKIPFVRDLGLTGTSPAPSGSRPRPRAGPSSTRPGCASAAACARAFARAAPTARSSASTAGSTSRASASTPPTPPSSTPRPA